MRRLRRGFTLVELLVVIGIIALLIGILLPALNRARQQALSVKCLTQMKELANAFAMYCNDNHGWLPSSDTCGPIVTQNFGDSQGAQLWTTVTPTQTWVGWVDGGPTEQAIENGTLWKYTKNAKLYKCPVDFNDFRTRTYSMNTYLCEGSSTPYNAGANVNQWKVYKITQVRETSRTIAFAEEMDPRSATSSAPVALQGQWNENGWQQNPSAANLPGTWVDTVASWHLKGANFSFTDGHAEYWRFSDPRTINYLKNDPTWPNPLYTTPNNMDLVRIQNAVVTWPLQRAQ